MKNFFQHIQYKYDHNTCLMLKGYCNDKRRLAKQQQRLKYLLRCKEYDIIPAHLRGKTGALKHNFHLHDTTKQLQKIEHTFLTKITRLEIKETHMQINTLRKSLKASKTLIQNILDEDEFDKFMISQGTAYQATAARTEDNLNSKIQREISGKIRQYGFIINDGWFVNKTDVVFPEECQWLLSLGEKFALPTCKKTFSPIHLIAEVEQAIQTIPEESQREISRNKFSRTILKHSNTMTNNSKETFILNTYYKTQKLLKDNNNIIVTNADKGNKTVVMYKDDYQRKMKDLLNDKNTYKTMRTDPTTQLMRKNNSIVSILFKKNYIDIGQKYKLNCNAATAPRLYGLPKIHKENLPLRPISASTNVPCYNMSKHIGYILKNIISSTHNIKNAQELKCDMEKLTIDEDELLVSFDVVSLFTNIPVNTAITTIMQNWNALKTHTNIPMGEFRKLLDYCLKDNNYFQYDNTFYSQTFGMPMGNPLSPTIADIVLDKILDDSISQLRSKNVQIKYVRKYVDDVIAIIKIKDKDEILHTLNSQHRKIQFTVEVENNNCIPFLDICIHRSNGRFKFNWHSKNVASGRLINFNSNHPLHQKLNTAKNLINKAKVLSDEEFMDENTKRLNNILYNNNYPTSIIQQLLHTAKGRNTPIVNTNDNKQTRNSTSTEETKQYMGIAYIRGITEERRLHDIIPNKNITYAHKPRNTLRNIFTNMKDNIDKMKRSDVIYEITCKGREGESCDQIYIGTTKRALEVRISEHKTDAEKKKMSTALAKHLVTTEHTADFDNAKILDIERRGKTRFTLESLRIQQQIHKTINEKEDTDNISYAYSTIIK